jgi:tetratricopeptide (TPR) repeat protein
LSEAASLYGAGRLEQAQAAYRRAVVLDPDDVRARYSLAVIDIRMGRLEAARQGLHAVVRHQPGLTRAQQNLAAVCENLGSWREAAIAYRRAIALDPAADESRFGLARCLTVLGRTAQAIDCYRALAAGPARRLDALARMAILDPSAVDETQSTDMAKTGADKAIDADTRAGLLFGLGGVLEARGEDDAAFAAFAAANALKRRLLIQAAAAGQCRSPAATAREHAQAVRLIKTIFTADLFARIGHGSGATSKQAPIFIVGMPRCGSSLVEQILASHRDVVGLGETAALPAVLEDPRAGRPYLAPASADVRGLAQAYLAASRAKGWREEPRFVDKTLENYLHVGMIHLMFPRALILHCQRDPLETCISCWRQLFAAGAETLYDLAEIGAEYRRVSEIMDHWRTVLPGRVIPVSYEDLIASPRTQIRRLVTQACGLAWDPACLRPQETQRAVRTASAAQVRQPISAASPGRRRRYEKHLAPLFEALGLSG